MSGKQAAINQLAFFYFSGIIDIKELIFNLKTMKNYLQSLGEPIKKAHYLIAGVMLAGLNLGLLAAFLILFVFFDRIEALVFPAGKYQYFTILVVAIFAIISVKLWVEFGTLIREKFGELKFGEKFKKILIVDLVGILPLLALVLLKSVVDGLKYLANPSSVTSWNVANSLMLTLALAAQILLVEAVALRKKRGN